MSFWGYKEYKPNFHIKFAFFVFVCLRQITFHEGRAYIVDQINSRILKWNPWTRQAHLFFGQKWSGDTLKQVSVPMSITFFQGFAYIADAMNHRVLKVRPGALEAEVFYKGTGYVSDITFFEGKAYVVQGGMSNRIMKMNPWQTFAAETFFGKHQPLLSPASCWNPKGLIPFLLW